MNITESIINELSVESNDSVYADFVRENTQIHVYANSNINKYQWRDSRFEETKDVWNNPMYDTRTEMRNALKTYIEKYITLQKTK